MKFNKYYLLTILVIFVIIIFNYYNRLLNSKIKNIFLDFLKDDTKINVVDSIDNSSNLIQLKFNNIDKVMDKIIIKKDTGFAEAYMDGYFETNNLEGVLSEINKSYTLLENKIKKKNIYFLIYYLTNLIKLMLPNNTLKSVQKNVSYHYDIGNDLYSKMLGKHMQYTCAYFKDENMTLDEAQFQKMELIASKLKLKPGMQVLDIGCGFGSMAHHLANNYQVNVYGVTLSKEQKKYADQYFSHPNVNIEIKDYRNIDKINYFDRIYSVEMFEQVGKKNYHQYYDKCDLMLKDDGIMFMQVIGYNTKGWDHNGFIPTYIFPEGELPHLQNLTKEKFIEKWNLEHLENLGPHYAKTLQVWFNNLDNWKDLDNYDEKFRKMWEFYLMYCKIGFQTKLTPLWHLVYTKHSPSKNLRNHYINY